MSLIHLQSNGQNPCDFFNVFPQQINIGKNAEVCVKGYSGVLALGVTPTSQVGVFDENLYIISTGNNDEFTVYHGEMAGGTAASEVQGAPFTVKIGAGQYSGGALAAEITNALNLSETNCSYTGGWLMANTANRFTLSLTAMRNIVETFGDWEETRRGADAGHIQPNTPVGFTTLTPESTADGQFGSFVNLRRGFLGNCSAAGAANVGFSYNFITEGSGTGPSTLADVQFTMGIATKGTLTQYRGANQTAYPNTKGYPMPIEKYSETANGQRDWALPGGMYAWVAYGWAVNPLTGQVGIITTNMRAGANTPLKNPANQSVEWLPGVANAIDLTGVADKQHYFCIKPSYSAGGEYQLEFRHSLNNAVGPAGAFTTLATLVLGSYFAGDNTALMTASSIHQVVYYDPAQISATSVDCVVSALDPDSVNQAPLAADPHELTTIQWTYQPVDFSSIVNAIPSSQLLPWSNQHANQLGLTMGWIGTGISSTTLQSAPVRSDVQPKFLSAEDGPPFLITCPDLPIQGYIGAAEGGGQQAPVLAIGTPMSSNYENAFQVDGKDTWISLKNEYPIRLTQLNIRLVDEHNKSYNRLRGNFSVWLQVRCPYREVNRETEVVGQMNNYERSGYPE